MQLEKKQATKDYYEKYPMIDGILNAGMPRSQNQKTSAVVKFAEQSSIKKKASYRFLSSELT